MRGLGGERERLREGRKEHATGHFRIKGHFRTATIVFRINRSDAGFARLRSTNRVRRKVGARLPASRSSRRPPSRWRLRRRPSLRQHLPPSVHYRREFQSIRTEDPDTVPTGVAITVCSSADICLVSSLSLSLSLSGGAGQGRARSPPEAGAGHLERKRRQGASGDARPGFIQRLRRTFEQEQEG